MRKSGIDNHLNTFVQNLRASLPYLERFYNELFVIKFSGDTLQQENLTSILDDLILLRRVGIRVIIVHGAALQINQLLKQNHKAGGYVEGRLILDEVTFPIAQRAIAAANWDLVTKLSKYGSDFFPITGHFLQARGKSQPEALDCRHVGEVSALNIASLQEAISQRCIPIIPPMGIGEYGKVYILDPNQVALEVAARLRAHKLIMLTSDNGNLKEKFGGKRQLTTQEVKRWLATEKTVDHFAESQIHALVEACERGVERCHALDSSLDGVLLGEILTSAGMGIMITNSSYQTVRPAEMRDLHMIAEILEKPMKDATIVTRGFQYLEKHVEHFIVFCVDEDVVGCCELLPFDENQSVELGSLAIKETHRNRGIGKRLVQAAVEQAIRQHRKLIFALSTGEGHLFRGLGFTPLPPDQLPDQKRENYDSSGSTIYGKFLRSDAS